MDIGNWLQGLGLAQYEPAFRDNDVDAEVLLRLTTDDLRELGVTSIGHRRRLLDAIAQQGQAAVGIARVRDGLAAAVAASAGNTSAEPPVRLAGH